MRDKTKKLNVALIGCGLWGSNFLRIIRQHPQCYLNAVCDSDTKKLANIRSLDLTTTNFIKDYKSLSNLDIDAAIVATPVTDHYKIVKYLLVEGKHVLCEKPLTISSKEALELQTIARRNQVVLMVGHVFLFNQGIIFAKEKLNKGVLGDIIYMHFQRTGLGPVRQDVNVLYDLASHDISIALYLLDRLPTAVTAFGKSHIQSSKEDVAFIQLEFEKVIINIHVSWIDPVKERKVTIIGTKKMLVFDDVSVTEKVRMYDKGISYQTTTGDFGDFQLAIRDGKIVIPNIKYQEPLKTEFDSFINAIFSGKNILSDAAFAADVIKVLEAAQVSLLNDNKKVYIK